MNPIRNSIKYLILFLPIIILNGCLKDNNPNPVIVSIANNIKILGNLEVKMISLSNSPPVVTPDEVYGNLLNYLLIDIRSAVDYSVGHIPGSINIEPDSLINYLNRRTTSSFAKIVLVDNDGQSSAYFAALLQFYGFDNIYSLNFGMSQWNSTYSNVWTSKLDSAVLRGGNQVNPYSPDVLYPLPNVMSGNNSSETNSIVQGRISTIIKEGFKIGAQIVDMDYTQGNNFYSINNELSTNYFIICYGKSSLYYSGIPFVGIIALSGSYLFVPGETLNSSSRLQTLPTDKKIAIYSVSGINSSIATAYLRILGYDAKTINYGASKFVYNFLIQRPLLWTPYLFLKSDIRNYPINAGPNP